MLPYLFTQRDVHSTTGKESLKPRLELGTQTHDALRPACQTSSGHVLGHYIEVVRVIEISFKLKLKYTYRLLYNKVTRANFVFDQLEHLFTFWR